MKWLVAIGKLTKRLKTNYLFDLYTLLQFYRRTWSYNATSSHTLFVYLTSPCCEHPRHQRSHSSAHYIMYPVIYQVISMLWAKTWWKKIGDVSIECINWWIIKKSYAHSLVENITNHFSNSLLVLTAVKIFDPLALSDRSDESFKEYGISDNNKDLTEELICQWKKFKYNLLQLKSDIPLHVLNPQKNFYWTEWLLEKHL